MLKSRIRTRDDLIDFCLRQNGAPVIEINIDPEQVEDAVDQTLEIYFDFHMDGVDRVYLPITLVQDDLDNEYVTLPDDVVSVVRLMDLDSVYSNNIQFQMYMTDVINQAMKGGVSSYIISQQHINTINSLVNREKTLRFNKKSSRVNIDTDWSNFGLGDVLLFECYKILDPEEFPSIYSDRWVIAYLTQLIKKQWATNIKKYSGTTMPGGVVLDAVTWYTEAVAEIEKLEVQLREWYEEPVLGMIG